jgi:hypothetical protein
MKKMRNALVTSFLQMCKNRCWLLIPLTTWDLKTDFQIANMNCYLTSAEKYLLSTNAYLAVGWTAIPRGWEMFSWMITWRWFPFKSLPSMTDFLKCVWYKEVVISTLLFKQKYSFFLFLIANRHSKPPSLSQTHTHTHTHTPLHTRTHKQN